MKTIAIIDRQSSQTSFSEFEKIRNQLIKMFGAKYNFIGYNNSKKTPLIFNNLFLIIHALFSSDVLFIKGTSYAWLFPFIRLTSNKKIIILTSKLKLKNKNKNSYLKFFNLIKEQIAIKFSHINITDHLFSKEYNTSNALHIKMWPGGDHVEHIETTSNDHRAFSFLKYQYVINICSVEPENKIEIILEAFTQIKNKFLVIIGDWESSQYGKNLKHKYSTFSNIFMLYTIDNKRNLDLIRSNAILYLHADNSSDRSILLIEAMSLKLPILALNNITNNLLTEGRAAYFNNSNEINKYLSNISIEKLRNNSLAMTEISSRRYRWSTICEKYESLINDLLSLKTKLPIKSKINLIYENELAKQYKL